VLLIFQIELIRLGIINNKGITDDVISLSLFYYLLSIENDNIICIGSDIMVENLESIYLDNIKFDFVGYSKNKVIFKNVSNEINEMKILEIDYSEEEKFRKIDIYTIEDEECVESIHITRGIDGITEVDYYPVYEKVITIDGKKDFYKMSSYIIYSETKEIISQEHCKLELIKRGHKRQKVLTQLPIENSLFITTNNKFHQVFSIDLNSIKRFTKSIISDIRKLENNILIKEKTKHVEQEELFESIVGVYPDSLYVYDRNYDLIGLKNNILLYRNLEDDITELEVCLGNNKDIIEEVRFNYYKDIEVEGIKNKSKKRTIIMIKEDDKIKASLYNYSKEKTIMSDKVTEAMYIKADAIITNTGKIEDMKVSLENQLDCINLTKTHSVGNYYINQNNEECCLNSYSYLTFKSLISFASGIFRNLENKLINKSSQNENQKVLVMKK